MRPARRGLAALLLWSLAVGCAARSTVRPVLHFPTGNADPSPDDRPMLERVAAYLVNSPGLRVQLEGHSDIDEPPGLAKLRADTVRSALVLRGVDPRRIETRAHAHTVAKHGPKPGQAGRRKVDFWVVARQGRRIDPPEALLLDLPP